MGFMEFGNIKLNAQQGYRLMDVMVLQSVSLGVFQCRISVIKDHFFLMWEIIKNVNTNFDSYEEKEFHRNKIILSLLPFHKKLEPCMNLQFTHPSKSFCYLGSVSYSRELQITANSYINQSKSKALTSHNNLEE